MKCPSPCDGARTVEIIRVGYVEVNTVTIFKQKKKDTIRMIPNLKFIIGIQQKGWSKLF